MTDAAADFRSGSASSSNDAGSNLLRRNVEAIAKVEAAVLEERSPGERWVRTLIRQVGRPRSVLVHLIVFAGWILWNLKPWPGHPVFDPYPFNLLALVTALEAILLGLLILTSQNRLQHEADRRAHLHLQIAMLAEMEGTHMLQMLDRLCRRFGVETGANGSLDELTGPTDPGELVAAIKDSMPAED